MGKTCSIEIEGETFELLPERAVYWPARHTLIVADLHWGKGETFRSHGVPIPASHSLDELTRLKSLLERVQAQRLIVLGDLIHAKLGMTENLIQEISDWRRSYEGEFLVAEGNHDRSWRTLPSDWNIEWRDQVEEGPFVFAHHAQRSRGKFIWQGHLHPTFRLRSATDGLRLPCYHFQKRGAVVPAFNFFARGVEMKKTPTSRVFVSTETAVFEI